MHAQYLFKLKLSS